MLSRRKNALVVLAACCAVSSPVFAAEFVSVCDRATEVQSFLTSEVNKTCDQITAVDLAAIKRVEIGDATYTVYNPEDFAGLPNLEVLNLNETGFTTLPACAFANLPNLKTLVLIHTSLTALPADFLVGASKLQGLIMFRDAFTTIPEGIVETIAALPSLTILQLGNNLEQPLKDSLKTTFPAGGHVALTFHN